MAIELAEEIGGEIVSADSMQIYKEMDIGTAKPTVEERGRVPHHLIDFISPDTSYSVAQFKEDADKKIKEIRQRGKIPIVCGGTGLYINALSLPYGFNPESTDLKVREDLEERAKSVEGRDELYNLLKTVDPKSALKIHPNNIKRVIRALEIYLSTGKTKSELDEENKKIDLGYTPVLFMPDWPREVLYDRINRRVDKMMEEGLLDEVRALYNKYDPNLTSLQALGYKEFYDYLNGKEDLDTAVSNLKRDTRHFAKRQLTWFRRDERIKKLKAN